ncbi:alpha/beta fold hydrolase [Agromyces archimandritae]|uniref:Alpha/beta fold hydrolase n=2 Tax=Agromyces archimandritae TaxID=2781962 RepID=A0A975FRX9_9MICO|nr:alpha/beta fold hydrolase [Agromyces archimandritae]
MPVLAVHGITATHRSWDLLAEALPEARIIAVDLRGRGRSNRLPGPYGLEQHADDLAAVLEHLGVAQALVVGHSMGGFVSVRLAERHPHSVGGLVLVDGGLPIPNPAGIPREELPGVLLGPALERLSMRFSSREEYLAFWRKHPALGPYWNDAIAGYVAYDVDGAEPELRSTANPDAVAVNALELDGSAGYEAALAALPGPVDVFIAPRGLLDAAPLYDPAHIREQAARVPSLRVHEVDRVNHYTITLAPEGVASLLPVIRERLGAAPVRKEAS